MAQHFLLSPQARTLTLRQVFAMSEERAYKKFKVLMWPDTKGKPVCPECGSRDVWTLVEHRKWKCTDKTCRTQFTVTSHTMFKSRKMAYRDLLAAIVIFANGVLGTAAGRLIREMGFAYKTAFVLAHKIRRSMSIDYDQPLEGVVEIDGAFMGTRRHRMPNKRIPDDKFEEFLKENPKKQTSLVTIRERPNGDPDHVPKVRAVHVPKEGDAVTFARKMVRKGTVMHADCGTQWLPLHAYFKTLQIDHSKSYSDGISCTNWAESFFSRVRCGERGVYRYFTRRYADRYGWEMAWREENRRVPNGRQVEMLITCALRSPPLEKRGYWQRRERRDGVLISLGT